MMMMMMMMTTTTTTLIFLILFDHRFERTCTGNHACYLPVQGVPVNCSFIQSWDILGNTEMGYILLKLAQVFCSRHVGLIFPNCSCSVVLVQGNPSCKVLKDCKDYGWLTLEKLLEEQSCYSIWLGILMKKSPNFGYPIQSRIYIYMLYYLHIWLRSTEKNA